MNTYIITGTSTIMAKDEEEAIEIFRYSEPDDIEVQLIQEGDEGD